MERSDGYRSWGRPSPAKPARVVRLHWRDETLPSDGGPFLAFGNGRSYGDSCLNSGGTLIDVRGLDRFISFDAATGVLRCEAGVLLADILARFVPEGWFVPVTPGTRFVTLGGAIANDVHGKNHHRSGSLGHHIRAFELLRSDGTRLVCSPTSNPDWFAATIGGLGLTGVILWADIVLKPVPGPAVEVETTRFAGIDEFVELSRSAHNSHEYTVAWIDSAADEARGLFFRGNHVEADGRSPAPPRRRPGPPVTPPFSLLPRRAVSLFNDAFYRLPRKPQRLEHYETFFYPLDAVPHWNRLYGRKGFFQYQCVVPAKGGAEAIGGLIRRVARMREASFLSVLKIFGDHPPAGWMSFPRSGITLALDIPDRGPPTRALLDELDEITREAGGAVYPAKDARMSPAMLERGYPNWRQLERYRDPAFTSDFWRRTTGIGHG